MAALNKPIFAEPLVCIAWLRLQVSGRQRSAAQRAQRVWTSTVPIHHVLVICVSHRACIAVGLLAVPGERLHLGPRFISNRGRGHCDTVQASR